MRLYTGLRLAFAMFLLYVAWPFIPAASTSLAKLFWIAWLTFFMLVIGGNFATLLRMSAPPVMEQEHSDRQYERGQ